MRSRVVTDFPSILHQCILLLSQIFTTLGLQNTVFSSSCPPQGGVLKPRTLPLRTPAPPLRWDWSSHPHYIALQHKPFP